MFELVFLPNLRKKCVWKIQNSVIYVSVWMRNNTPRRLNDYRFQKLFESQHVQMFTGRTVLRQRTNWDAMCYKWKQVLMHIDHICIYSQCVFLILAVTVSRYCALSTSTCLMYCLFSLPLLSSTIPLCCNNCLFSKVWRFYLSCQFISYSYDRFTYECYLTSIYKCGISMAMGNMQEL